MSTNKGPEQIYSKLAKVVKRNQIINTVKQCVSHTEKYRQRDMNCGSLLPSAGRRSESSQPEFTVKKKKKNDSPVACMDMPETRHLPPCFQPIHFS